MFLLQPVNLLNSFISSNFFFVECLGFSMNSIVSFASMIILIAFSPILLFFISFNFSIVLAKSPSTMLSGERGQFLLVLDLREDDLKFSLFSDIGCWSRIYTHIILKYFPSIPNFLRVFFTKGC